MKTFRHSSVSYTHLVAEDTELRKQLREAGVDYKVYKNTMINFAVKDTQFEGIAQYLEGPTAVVFAYDEATKGASIVKKVSETAKNLEFKAGVVEGICLLYTSRCV